MNQQLKGLAWLALTVLVGATVAVGLPYFAGWIPWSVEKHAAVYVDFSSNDVCGEGRPEQTASLNKIIARLYPVYPEDHSFPLTVTVIRGDTVNAFAGLAGHVRIYNGLLQQAQSPEELAGILAHEIEHVRHRHIMQSLLVRLSTTGALQLLFANGKGMGPALTRLLLNARFTRTQEHEADVDGLKRLQAAHISGDGFVRFFERAQTNSDLVSLLSDHPANDDRAALARQYASASSEPIVSESEWKSLKAICYH